MYETSSGTEIMKGTISGTSITDYYEHTTGSPVAITMKVRYVSGGTEYLPWVATSSIGDDVFSYKVDQIEDTIIS
jgi:hypothetical protein